MNPRRFILDSLRHHRRMHVAVALGTAVATAVLTGALLVGDSVRGSLLTTALDRLGGVDEVLVGERFFRQALADEWKGSAGADAHAPDLVATIILQGSVTNPETRSHAAHVGLFGAWDGLGDARPRTDDEITLNESLAEELGVGVGDEVIVRLPASREVPDESALGRKTDQVANSSRLKVRAVVPARGVGAFSLRPNQQIPKNAFLTLPTLQKILKKPDRVNALLAFHRLPATLTNDLRALSKAHDALSTGLHPTLADYGLKWTAAKPGYFSLTSERMLFDPATAAAAQATYRAHAPQPVYTYLANTIALGTKDIPYSTIAALDMVDRPTLGPFVTPEGTKIERIADDEIVLSKWAADDLQAKPGDAIRIAYFEPESTHGDVREAETTLKLRAVADLKSENDPLISSELTPELVGVTDQLKMNDWDPPFPYEARRIRKTDEDYWDRYRATPKGFVSAATGRRLWSSRFGDVTSLRIAPQPGSTVEKLAAEFHPNPAALGFEFQPARLRAIEASTGTTPFEGLFLGFSFFIIAAAVMLTTLLFRLGVEQRAGEVGLMFAVGLPSRTVAGLLLREGAVVAVVGAALGLALGVGYAWLMLAGLRTLWLDAVTVPFLTLFVTVKSLVVGYVAGVAVSLGAIAWSLRALRRLSVRRLLSGQAAESDLGPSTTAAATNGLRRYLPWGCLIGAAASAFAATKLKDEAQAGAFLGSAALVLTALLVLLRRRLVAARFGSLVTFGPGRIAVLAVRNAARNPGRSMLTVGLVAGAAFLIVGVSAFRIAPPSTYVEKSSGTGGFALVAETDLPILQNLDTDDGRIDLSFSQAARKTLAGARVYSLRFRPGDDSSCLNLYQTEQPRVLGVPDALVERGGFSWADHGALPTDAAATPWRLLQAPTDDGRVPIVLDQATAIYGLHLSGVGATLDLPADGGEVVPCRVAGLLRNSVLQGSVLMSESHFKRRFPEVGGYRFFLVEASPEHAVDVERELERGLADYGFDAQPSDRLLRGFLAVQNTYLSTFQSLGGLGLLLGTFGLATVQLRNALERRGELALLRAVGLPRSQLARLVFCENAALLAAGLAIGVGAASVAVLPHALVGGAGVPWAWLAGTLGAVLVAGLATGAVVVRRVLQMPVLTALRDA